MRVRRLNTRFLPLFILLGFAVGLAFFLWSRNSTDINPDSGERKESSADVGSTSSAESVAEMQNAGSTDKNGKRINGKDDERTNTLSQEVSRNVPTMNMETTADEDRQPSSKRTKEQEVAYQRLATLLPELYRLWDEVETAYDPISDPIEKRHVSREAYLAWSEANAEFSAWKQRNIRRQFEIYEQLREHFPDAVTREDDDDRNFTWGINYQKLRMHTGGELPVEPR